MHAGHNLNAGVMLKMGNKLSHTRYVDAVLDMVAETVMSKMWFHWSPLGYSANLFAAGGVETQL